MSNRHTYKTNLLEETKEVFKTHNFKVSDIVFIGSSDGKYGCSWREFTKLADFTYNSGYGSQKVVMDLVIVFVDGTQMIREEYDGAEWWDVRKPFRKPVKIPLPIKSLHKNLQGETIMWETLESIHEESEPIKEVAPVEPLPDIIDLGVIEFEY